MSIYSKSGNALTNAYNKGGSALPVAYNKGGSVVFNADTTLKIMAYNVGQWYDGSHTVVPSAKDADYYNLQNGMIANDDPDILCLEEYLSEFSATGRTSLSMLEQYFPYIHEQNGTGTLSSGAGRCICSKYPITNYTTHQFSTSGSPRYYDSCTITVNDIPITVVVTHLNYNSSSNTARVGQLNELITFLQSQTRFIACGDYNTLLHGSEDADYNAMIVPMLNAGFHLANCSDEGFLVTYSDEPSGTWTGCLDNIVTSSNIDILSASVDDTKLHDSLTEKTDHMPLIAVVQLN